MNTSEKKVDLPEDATDLSDNRSTGNKSVKVVTTDMPIAIAIMILFGCGELRDTKLSSGDKNKLNLLLAPFWNPQNPEKSKKYVKENLFRNNLISQKGTDDTYKAIFDHIGQYHFDKLIDYLHYFYEKEECPLEIVDFTDIKKCYNIITKHQTKTPNTRFDHEYCWAIASFFLFNFAASNNPSDEYDKLIKSYVVAEDTDPIRKEMIRRTSGDVYITGTTLKDAFSISYKNKINSIILDLIQNPDIDNIYIFVLNYKFMGINQESASKEIETSLTNIMDYILKADDHCPKVDIIMLNNFSIPFSLIANEELLTRSTYMFSYARNYRGQYLLFDSNDLEYTSIKNYLDLLRQNAYELDMSPLASANDVVKQKYRQHIAAYKEKGLKIKKIHPVQLENLVRRTFTEDSEHANAKDDSQFTIPKTDDTQKVLLPYLAETERLLEKLVRMHDPKGWAKVIPCNDLGFPNNVMRIAGGFLTGAYYNWSCAVPIIPVDATINTCTSSVFKLKNFDADALDDKAFQMIVKEICASAMKNGYAFQLDSGNHFLMVSKDDEGNYYLVLHCSAKQAKESCFGLYPSERVWYKRKIKTLYNDNQTRYIRYIRSDTAVRFIDYANRFRDFNQEMHLYIAEEFLSKTGAEIVGQPIIKHHYGMPDPNSIAIGTFVVDTRSNNESDLVVPIFSDLGKDICIYSVDRKQDKTYTPSGTSQKIVLVPHGWGQVIKGIKNIHVDNVREETKRQLILEASDKHELKVISEERIKIKDKCVRQFESVSSFLDTYCQNINGRIKTMLHPVYCYCSRTVKIKKESKDEGDD